MNGNSSSFSKTRRLLIVIILLLVIIASAYAIYLFDPFGLMKNESPSIEIISGVNLNNGLTQENISEQKEARKEYSSDDMVLRIERLKLETKVQPTTSDEDLKKGPGLYEYAQMPGTENCNTSIAGHRDLYDRCFYSIDKLQRGDKIYLDYLGYRYTYDYYSTRIVAKNDWSVIQRQGFSCITLTSCHPIGTNLKRIVVVGLLSDIERMPEK